MWISTHEIPQDAEDFIAEDDSGYMPVELHDLESGDVYEIETRVTFVMVRP